MAILQIPITKGKDIVEIDTDSIPNDVLVEVYLQGLKTLLNRGMTKVTEKDLGSVDAVKAEAMIIAKTNLEKVLKGDIKFSGKTKTSKVSGAVNTEAMRLARIAVKDAIKAAGMKISNVPAKEVTAAAKELVNTKPEFIEQATANLAERAKAPVAIDIKSLVHEDAKLVAKNEAKAQAAKKDKPLSAAKSGQVKGRKAPKAQPTV